MVFHKILIVEDDEILALALKDFFEENDFKVIHVVSGEEAVDVYEKERPSIVLLDVMLPGMNGFEVVERIRKTDNSIPVIMMTGTEYETDSQVKGYHLGAVNYIQKPVTPQVLLAQVRSLLNSPEIKRYKLNDYYIIIRGQEVKINDEIYELRDRDAKVLSLLLQRQNEFISRKDLMLSVWKDDRSELNNHLDSSISRIKSVLKKYSGIKIESKYAVGYRIVGM